MQCVGTKEVWARSGSWLSSWRSIGQVPMRGSLMGLGGVRQKTHLEWMRQLANLQKGCLFGEML